MPQPFFVFALTLYVLVLVTRVHEAIPALQSLYLGKVSVLVLFVAIGIQRDRSLIAAALRTKTARCIGVITILAILSVPGSFWPHESVDFLSNRWWLQVVLFVSVAAGFAHPRTAHRLIVAMTAGATLAAGQLLVGAGLDRDGRAFLGGGSSATYDPNDSATFFVLTIPYAMLLASRRGWQRWLGLTAIPMLLAAALKTGSRGGVIAAAGLFVFMFATGDRKRRVQCLVLAAVAAVVFSLIPHDELMQRFSDVFSDGSDYNYTSRDGRMQIWSRGMGLMLAHPLLGVGVGSYEIANGVTAGSWKTAHNSYIEIGVELGVLGIGAFLAAIAYSLAAAWRQSRQPVLSSERNWDGGAAPSQVGFAVLASLVSVLIGGIFLSLAYSSLLIFALAAAAGLGIRGQGGRQSSAALGRGSTTRSRELRSGWRSAGSAMLSRRPGGV